MSDLNKLKNDLIERLNKDFKISIIEEEGNVLGIYYNNGVNDKYIPFKKDDFFERYDLNIDMLVDVIER